MVEKHRDFADAYTKNPSGYSTRPSDEKRNDERHHHNNIFGQFRTGAQDAARDGTFGNPDNPVWKRGPAFGTRQ